MKKNIFILFVFAIVTACSVTNTKPKISVEEAIDIAKRECGECGSVSIEKDGKNYIVSFAGIVAPDSPMLGGGGGMVIVDSFSGKVVKKLFLE
ncbi:hypothetical protein ACJJI4_01275 [Microbulbifer sp. TRSA002]|uniref:hypothetical protein n=1 Tax=Microbulbifer sp. TRSA002 TaxID=3243382 RepID=UPI00403921C7